MSKLSLFNEGKRLIALGDSLLGVQMLEEASAAGSVKASAFLGFGFYLGRDGLPCNKEMAEKYLNVFIGLASPNNKDLADAHCFLGCIYYFREAGKKDIKIAIQHFKESAERGNMIGAYYHGIATTRREDLILKWILMPVIFLIIVVAALISDSFGWNENLVSVVITGIILLLILAYISNCRKYWLKNTMNKR